MLRFCDIRCERYLRAGNCKTLHLSFVFQLINALALFPIRKRFILTEGATRGSVKPYIKPPFKQNV